VLVIYAATNGHLDKFPVSAVSKFEEEFLDYLKGSKADLRSKIEQAQALSDELKQELDAALAEFTQGFQA